MAASEMSTLLAQLLMAFTSPAGWSEMIEWLEVYWYVPVNSHKLCCFS